MKSISLLKYLVLIAISMVTLAALSYLSGEYQPVRYHAWLCNDKNAAPDGDWHQTYDGFFIGKNGCLYNPKSTNISNVPAINTFKASSGKSPIKEPIWYINGIDRRIEWTLLEMKLLSQKAERPVVGIYNSTKGGRIPDTLVKIDENSAPVETLSAAIAQHSAQKHAIFIHANKQGSEHVSIALQKAMDALSIAFNDKKFERIENNIHVETSAATTGSFPSGPKYLHYVNYYDPVPEKTGILSEQSNSSDQHENTVIARFADKDTNPVETNYHWLGPWSLRFNQVHGFNIYLKYRQPFNALHEQGKEQAGKVLVTEKTAVTPKQD